MTPNLCHDMHDCDVAEGDAWVRETLDPFLSWAQTHNSMLVVTFDEAEMPDDHDNAIATVFAGPMVRPGEGPAGRVRGSDRPHSILRTLEDMYDLPAPGRSADAEPITDGWEPVGGPTPEP